MADQRAVTLVTSTLMAFFAIVAVALRALARRKCKAGFGADDWTIFAALPFVLALCALCLAGAIGANFGLHTPKLPSGSYEFQPLPNKIIWVMSWLVPLGPGFTKISVLLFYKRIFLGVFFHFTSLVLLVLSVIWTVAFFFATFLSAIPLKCEWQEGDDSCAYLGHTKMLFAAVFSDVLLDVLILSLPWYPISRLQLPWRRKVSVLGIFALGAIVVAASIARLLALKNSINASSPDVTYVYAPALYWSAIEAGTGIVGACLPTLGPLFKDHRRSSCRGREAAKDAGGTPSSFHQSLLYRVQGSPDPIQRELDEIYKAQSNCISDSDERLEDGLRDLSLPARPSKAVLPILDNKPSYP